MLKKERAIMLIVLTATLMLLASSATSAVKAEETAQTARIWTDKADYAPGETVIIYGEGFQGTVTITVVRPDGTVNDPENGIVGEWTVNADENGMFETTYKLDGILGEYTVTATDEYGNTATTTFTDSLNVRSVWTTDSNGNPKDTFFTTENVYAKIHVVGSGTTITVRIYVLSSQPKVGDTLSDVSGGYETQSFSNSGVYGPFLIWPATTTSGNYYVLVDEDNNGYCGGDEKAKAYEFSITAVSISIEKSANVTMAHVGEGIKYSYTVTNTGGVQLTNIYIDDNVTGTINVGTLGPGSSAIVYSDYTVKATDSDPLVNNATVYATYSSQVVSAWAIYTVNILHPEISVSKSGPEYAHEGVTITYTITVENTGDCELTGVTVVDDVLGDLTSYLPDTTLDVGEVNQFTVNYEVPSPSGDITNTVTASGTDELGLEVSDEASWFVDILHPEIMVTKVADVTMAYIGDTIEYTINVTNIGDCTLYGVNVTDSLFGDLLTNEVLDAKESAIFTLTYTVESYGLLTNTVIASGEDALGLAVSDSASWTVTVLPKSMVTTSSLCYFDLDSVEGQQFRLIFTQDPTNLSTYKLTASNPGQFYYNVFYIGTGPVSLKIRIPYPFVTQGAVPMHVYNGVSIVDGCFVPSGDITTSFTITPKLIALGDYTNGYVEITVSGTVPESGLVYVTIHLDYGLKKTVGYKPDSDKNAEKPIGTDVIVNGASYIFEVSSDLTDSQTIQSVNVFKRDPGFAGIVTDSEGNPLAGVEIKIYGPNGKLLATVKTDEDGWYFFNYKHIGKAATYTIVCNGITRTVTLKANQLVQVDFTL